MALPRANLGNAPFGLAIKDFYLTNPIASGLGPDGRVAGHGGRAGVDPDGGGVTDDFSHPPCCALHHRFGGAGGLCRRCGGPDNQR